MKRVNAISIGCVVLAAGLFLLQPALYAACVPEEKPGDEEERQESAFAPDEIIIKLDSNAGAKYLKRGLLPKSLKKLNETYGVKEIAPVFEGLVKTLKKENISYTDYVKRIKKKHPKRSARAPKGIKAPNLSCWYKLRLGKGADVPAAVDAYEKNSCIEAAQPNYTCKLHDIPPNDPFYNSYGSWGQDYDDLWGLKKIECEDAWSSFGLEESIGQGVIVAVVDTGVHYGHEDLAANIWQNLGEDADGDGHTLEYIGGEWVLDPGDLNGADDDGNWYADDLVGWDFGDFDSDPIDIVGHGSHCAGTIAAATDNRIGVAGISWHSRIMPAKGFSDSGSGYIEDLVLAIEYAVENGADVISNSWGPSAPAPSNPIAEDAVRAAYAQGVVVVFSAGNDCDNVAFCSPNHLDEVITVAATTQDDVKCSFSNWGHKIDVCAPGGGYENELGTGICDIYNILSTMPDDSSIANDCGGDLRVSDGYYRIGGTSMACPHVSGLAALVLSYGHGWSNSAVMWHIKSKADDIDDANPGLRGKLGGGRINAYASVVTYEPETDVVVESSEVDDSSGNGDSKADPGENIALTVFLRNTGEDTQNVSVDLSTTNPFAIIGSGHAEYTEITYGELVQADFDFSVAPSFPADHDIEFTVTITYSGSPKTEEVTVPGCWKDAYVYWGNTQGPWEGTQEHPYQYIQQAIDSVVPYTRIRVAEGVYEEVLVVDEYKGLYGGYDPEDWTRDIEENVTVIDAMGISRVITFVPGVGVETELSGFTIRNGAGCLLGGGVLCYSASPTIMDNVITGNAAVGSGFEMPAGGGILYYNSSTTLSNNLISDNSVNGCISRGGGVCALYSSITISSNTLAGNTASARGGGIDSYISTVTITGNVITGNEAGDGGGICYEYESSGSIIGNTIADNTASSDGGGVAMIHRQNPDPLVIQGNTIVENKAEGTNSNGYGGGIYGGGTPLTLVNNIIAGNSAKLYGGGIDFGSTSPACSVTNNTVVDNFARFGGGGIRANSGVAVKNSIIWGNEAGEDAQILGSPEVTYSDVEGGWEGEGNIDEDPLLVNPLIVDYHLVYGSPCIDSGTNEGAPSDDFEGETRPNGDAVDMGADEWCFTDEDGDGMGDHWERHYFGDTGEGPEEDYDEDGYTNLEEYENGTDPTEGIHPQTYYVSDSIGDDAWTAEEARNQGTPWKTIVHALTHPLVCCGDTVMVAEGTYREKIHFHGKAITLSGADPYDPAVVAATVIDGEGNGSVVTFNCGEGPDSVLTGFTICNGESYQGGGVYCRFSAPTLTRNIIRDNSADIYGGGSGGGIYCHSSAATLSHNSILDNVAQSDGGGIYCTGSPAPSVSYNTIRGNLAYYGGGISLFHAPSIVLGNIIEYNRADGGGGGLLAYRSSVTLIGNTITNNSAYGHYGEGGGVNLGGDSLSVLTNNIIARNYAGRSGGGISVHRPGAVTTLMNNTVVYNTAEDQGGGIYSIEQMDITNSVVWGNVAGEDPQIHGEPAVAFSDIQGGWPGEGNIDAEPLLANPSGEDFHLVHGSPCIGTGLNKGAPADDLEGEARPHGTAVDMGADEWYFTDDDEDDMGDYWERHYFGDTGEGPEEDYDEDGYPNLEEYKNGTDPTEEIHPFTYYVSIVEGDDSMSAEEARAPGTPWKTLGRALSHPLVCCGDTVIVSEGTYLENIDFYGKAVTLESTDPENPAVVAATIIDGGGRGSVVVFAMGEEVDSALRGFTITNGMTSRGSGVYCFHASPSLTNNVIRANTGVESFSVGGGVYLKHSSAVLTGNTIADNIADTSGGGIYCTYSSPTLIDNILTDNEIVGPAYDTEGSGGGIYCYESNPCIEGNVLSGNTATNAGGGICCDENSSPDMRGNIIRANESHSGGGIRCINSSHPTLTNNIIVDNTANYGGGITFLYSTDPLTVSNCTVANNSAVIWGGGILSGGAAITITNSIIWGNDCDEGAQFHIQNCFDPTVINYSNIQGGWAGESNIAADPLFTSPSTGDYHLIYGSPCIDSGTTAGAPAVDFEGEARPSGGGVDMGADEWILVDDDEDGLDDRWEVHYFGGTSHDSSEDPDGDGHTNLEEYGEGTNPTRDIYTYYVNAVTGDDLRTAVEARNPLTPWASIGRALYDADVCRGDTVIVAEGTYCEKQNFNGKAITVRSTDPDDPAVVEATIIDGCEAGTVVTFNSGEVYDSVLSGFTITNGEGGWGGGIHCFCSCPTLSKNRIVDNNGIDSGGGMYCRYSSPRVNECTIEANSAHSYGGGIHCKDYSSPTVIDTEIAGNTVYSSGGGLYCEADSRPCIIDSVIDNNQASHAESRGGGINLHYSSATLKNTIISYNSAYDGGGVYLSHSSPVLSNTTVADNIAGYRGGGMHCYHFSSPQIENSVIWGNEAPEDPGIHARSDSYPGVTYSDVQGGWSGAGNINEDPLFFTGSDGDYYLSQVAAGQAEDSDCVDAGDPSLELIEGTTRTDAFPDDGIVDMGYHYPGLEQEIIYVDDDNTGGPWYGTEEFPYQYIQDGIDSATDIDIVLVAEGAYYENIDFLGKAITVTSVDPHDPSVVAATIIDGEENGTVVTFDSGEGPLSVLSGFTIQNGNAGSGGGIKCQNSSPTISNCVITGNEVSGVAMSGDSSPRLENCVIRDNYSTEFGGGLSWYGAACSPSVINCVIVENTASVGGGIYCDGPSSAVLKNTIIWGNVGSECPQIYNEGEFPTVIHCAVQGGWPGEGNIDGRPLFANPAVGDYRLVHGSACIDAGTGAGAPATDFEGEGRPYGEAVDIGIDEHIPVDNDGDGLDDGWEIYYFGDLVRDSYGDYDGDGETNGQEYEDGTNPAHAVHAYYVSASEGDDSRTAGQAMNPDTPWRTITRALGAVEVCFGDTVVVFEGTYMENIDFGGKAITLRSYDPDVPASVENTVIDGGGSGSVVTFGSGETRDSVIAGFTIQNGSSSTVGGGVRCAAASPTIENCRMLDNTASWPGGGAIGCDSCSPAIVGNVLSGNYALMGGAISCSYSSALIRNNLIADNSGGSGGGIYLWHFSPVLAGNTIVDNSASYRGGGICCDHLSPVITDSIVWGNEAPSEPQISDSWYGQPEVAYCDVHIEDPEQVWPGEGNINEVPIFAEGPDGGYYLSQVAAGQDEDSPCVDAGDPASHLPIGTTRIDEVLDSGLVDMGYHYPSLVLFVDIANSDGPWEGTRDHPYQDVRDAVDSAEYGFGIIVAEGEYYGQVTLKPGIALYGGYEGEEWTRDIRENGTVIVNEWTSPPVPNNYTVIAAEGGRIDGFTIEGFDGIQSCNCSPVVVNNTICVENVGLYTRNDAHPYIGGNIFFYNNSNNGIECWDKAHPTIVNNLIVGNAEDGICIGHKAFPFICNNTIYINGDCGVGCFAGSAPTIQNNIIVANGAGIRRRDEAAPVIRYNDVWGSEGLNYDGCAPGDGDISADPLFVSPGSPDEDYHLQEDSPCIDMGIDDGAPIEDFEGNSRPVDIPGVGHEETDTTDMGAYEYQAAKRPAI